VIVTLAWGLGLVLVIEGLVWALAPGMVEKMLLALRDIPQDQRRIVGLGVVAAGVALVWLAGAPG
jgi:uncharacterized protein